MTGGQLRDMPREFGASSDVHNRFRQWRNSGVFAALVEDLIAGAAKRGEADLSLVDVDSPTARAHHDAARLLLDQNVTLPGEHWRLSCSRSREVSGSPPQP
jgi:hypothetical protein